MDIDKDIYHSNGMLGLIPVDESEALSFHFGGKLINSDSKDFFNCDTSIGLEYPVRSALQPICVHVDGAESTKWVNPPCDENVDLLDISSKRLPVDLGINGLDKSSIYSSSNGSYTSSNLTPNNHVMITSLPTPADTPTLETSDYYGNQLNESFSMKIDYTNHSQYTDIEKFHYNGNQSLYSNGYHSQHYDHHGHNLAHQQIYHNHSQSPSTPSNHYQQQKKGQQPFQRQFTHRRRLNLYEKPSPTPIKHRQKQQPSQSPVQAQKPPKPQKSPLAQKPQKLSPKIQNQQLQGQPQQAKPKAQQQIASKRKKQRIHVKSLEAKPELNQRVLLERKSGRARKYDYSPPKPTKFRSPRLRLKVQSELEGNSEDIQESGDTLESEQSEVQEKVKKVKEKEVLPCDWIRPDNLTFDRLIVSDYEKASLPEFFAGKFDRTHFHPSQYLQIRNLFLDAWESRKPRSVHFREMIRMHRGIGNVVSFSRVCKFLTAIGAINEISQDDDDDDEEVNKDDVTKVGIKSEEENDKPSEEPEESQSNSKVEGPEDQEDPSNQPSPLSPSTIPTPPSSSPERQTNELSSVTSSSPSLTQSEESSSRLPRPRRKGRKRKSYFLNEMTRLGIDPLSAGIPIPESDKEEDEDTEQT